MNKEEFSELQRLEFKEAFEEFDKVNEMMYISLAISWYKKNLLTLY